MVDLLEARRRILLNTPHLESLSGTTASFETDMASKLKECKIHFTPIQEGSGDPSPDNVRPIHGWDGVTIYRGVNILEGLQLSFHGANSSIYSVNGRTVTYTAIGEACDTYIDVRNLRGKSLTLNHRPTGNSGGFAFYSETNITSFISGIANNGVTTQGSWTITVPTGNDVNYMRFTANPNYIDDVMLITDYSEISIPFPQTIYGGYVDLINGEVVETYVSRKINTANFGTRLRTNVTDYRGADDYYKSRGLSEFPAPLSNDTYLCDKLYNTGRVTTTGGLTAYMYCNFGSSKYMYVYALASELSEDTLDGLRAYISDLDPQFVYKVNETDYTTYPLDPVTIRTLKGLNNIWSDANGNIELKFWTH